jgi:hypothetical protein
MYKKIHFVRYLSRALSFVCVVTYAIQQGGCTHTTCSCCFAQQYLFFLVDDLKVILGNLCTGHVFNFETFRPLIFFGAESSKSFV